ncbi:flagellar basal-body rod protein FlgC [Rhodomicrobium vannielii ATCC 17100]|jgi:flagellar basal-body rod protein FlgC|uniref:Flagellar basal-body rod protein FlgC n=1 Tax=Rhodomicrobium vannielii (strain ATCC 17100 / DSM 162 / LMG 4299 / NCIMB 10020 / ATH 3.1.1) TaxID=648757 RepID=E3I683_RHOVT|nr:flagellar basal-body rod protein FlgC [Rhodomicrobium vannielii ATCC 17100]
MTMDNLSASLAIAGSGLSAQSQRIRVATENLANSESTGKTPGALPYTRKILSFDQELDAATGAELVIIGDVDADRSPYRIENIPGHPAADAQGNVKLPNVNVLVELADIREGTRSYEANLQVIKQVRHLETLTIDILKV